MKTSEIEVELVFCGEKTLKELILALIINSLKGEL